MQAGCKSGFESKDFDDIKGVVEKHTLEAGTGALAEIIPINLGWSFCPWPKAQRPALFHS